MSTCWLPAAAKAPPISRRQGRWRVKVLVADNAAYAKQLAENVSLLIAELGKGYSHILAPASTNGKNFLPRVRRTAGCCPDLRNHQVVSADTFVRPIYAGNAMATVQSTIRSR
jgi:electron transfer flavoprotein alpha subunit